MISLRTKTFVLAVSTLAGTIIGVGFFVLPYVTTQVGIWAMLAYFSVLGGIVILIHWLFGQVALETPDFLRLPGYVERHLGSGWKKLAGLSMILGTFGALLAYMLIGGKFLNGLLGPAFGGSEFLYTLIYFGLSVIFIYFGIKSIAKLDVIFLISLFLIFSVIALSGLPYFKLKNLLASPSWDKLFLPYGPILFALWGATMIPEIEEMLGRDKKLLGKAIFVGVLIPILVYLFFIVAIVGVSGAQNSPDAISGLKPFLGEGIIGLGYLLGILATFTSFIALGLTLRKVFTFDFKINPSISFLLTAAVPLLLFLWGFQDFLSVISLVGGVAMGLEGILILLMYKKIRPNKVWLVLPLLLIFVLGMGYEIVYSLK